MDKLELRKRVVEKIKDRTRTQKDIAKEVGFTEVTISKIMKGKDVSIYTLQLIDLKMT